MQTMLSQLEMHSAMDLNSLILLMLLEVIGNVHSTVVLNGSGKSEYLTEETAVEEDSRELKSVLVAKSVDKSLKILEMDNGTKLNVPNQ